MQASRVDPRTIGREVHPDIYRVCFHDETGASDEWRLTAAESVVDCIHWADAHADGRTYVLYAELLQPGVEPLLARLCGTDPNAR